MWIARNKDNRLFVFRERPLRYYEEWTCEDNPLVFNYKYEIDKGEYSEVTWENSPIELITKL